MTTYTATSNLGAAATKSARKIGVALFSKSNHGGVTVTWHAHTQAAESYFNQMNANARVNRTSVPDANGKDTDGWYVAHEVVAAVAQVETPTAAHDAVEGPADGKDRQAWLLRRIQERGGYQF